VVAEALARSRALSLAPGATLAALPGAKGCLILVVRGALVYAPSPSPSPTASVAPSAAAAAAAAASNAAAAPPALFAGDQVGEFALFNRPASRVPSRDPACWVGAPGAGAAIVAVPASLLRRLLLSESFLLGAWPPHALAAAAHPSASPLRPPPRAALLSSDADGAAVARHAALVKALLYAASGGHIGEGAERSAPQQARSLARLAARSLLCGASRAFPHTPLSSPSPSPASPLPS
jgi:hypothetical protein